MGKARENIFEKIKEFVDSWEFFYTVLNPDGDHGC